MPPFSETPIVQSAKSDCSLIDGSGLDPARMSDAAHPIFDVELCNIHKMGRKPGGPGHGYTPRSPTPKFFKNISLNQDSRGKAVTLSLAFFSSGGRSSPGTG